MVSPSVRGLTKELFMPILHVVIMLLVLAGLAVVAGINWLYVAATLAVTLLVVIAAYRRV